MGRSISVLGVNLDLGKVNRGTYLGPTALRDTGLIQTPES